MSENSGTYAVKSVDTGKVFTFKTLIDVGDYLNIDSSYAGKLSKRNGIYNRHLLYRLENVDNVSVIMNNVLVIADIHEPFCHKDYMGFCKRIYDKYKCNRVVFIGDIIDNHYTSFHDVDPDGNNAAEELRKAKENIAKWYELFPNAYVCLGNHDVRPDRKAFNSGISKTWIKTLADVLETPNWIYNDSFVIDGVLYTHGINQAVENRMYKNLMSCVQGHYHSKSNITYSVGENIRLFGMQLGCGVDEKAYAMAYNKFGNKMHINCGVVLDNGKQPIIIYMD